MRTNNTRTAAGKLARAKQGFDQWRRLRKRQERIPARLWRLATDAASSCGIQRTAQQLRINATRLKQQMQEDKTRPSRGSEAHFFELPWLQPAAATECILELEDLSGRKLRIELRGGAAAQATTLSSLLWRVAQ